MSDLEELRRLSEAATPGPWREVGRDVDHDRFVAEGRNPADAAGLGCEIEGPPEAWHRGQFENHADAAFIAASANFVRDLLSNPTSSVSTEGVADLDVERCSETDEAWSGDRCILAAIHAGQHETGRDRAERMETALRKIAAHKGNLYAGDASWMLATARAALTAINPDSPVPQISAKENQTLAEPRCSDCSCCSAAKVLGVCGNCDQGNLTCDDCPDINPDSVDPKP